MSSIEIRGVRERHAVITGAGRGIGAAIAVAFAATGARVTMLGRTAERLNSAQDALKSRYLQAATHTVIADITSAEQVAAAIDAARVRFGPVHFLVNCAGEAASAAFADTDEALWARMIDVNLTGAYRCTRAVLPDMLTSGFGRIVNVASTAGLRGYPHVSAYVASKHGLIGLTRALALELARKSITVNAVCPGYTDTDIVREAATTIATRSGRTVEDARALLIKTNPQGRLIQPEEVAAAVLWLCGPDSGSINGQALTIAGGEVMA